MGMSAKIAAMLVGATEIGTFAAEIPYDVPVMDDHDDRDAENTRPGSSHERPPKPKRRKP